MIDFSPFRREQPKQEEQEQVLGLVVGRPLGRREFDVIHIEMRRDKCVLPTAFADDDGTLSNPQDYPPIPEMPNGATMETEAKEYCEHLMRAYHRKWAKSVEEARELDRKNGTAKWG